MLFNKLKIICVSDVTIFAELDGPGAVGRLAELDGLGAAEQLLFLCKDLLAFSSRLLAVPTPQRKMF